ncbi:MAG TPA: sigma 54-interacting transcriptional regulator [Polyangiaceae bacterium]|nr:sigma 54-interacting transcriptional regulator [Polyangiaceae bacterium]
MALAPGDELAGRYRVVSPLGAGGAASVFLVEDTRARTGRILKQLRLTDPELVASFRAEFALLATLAHPFVTHVHDFGAARVRGEVVHFYTAERIEGSTLAEHARRRRDRAVLDPLLDALEGLSAVHELGVRHGDFTLENVLVRSDGRGVLIDFGCARPFNESAGTLAGTPGYLAPELLTKGGGDGRADLYAVGSVLERLVRLGALRREPRLEALVARLLAEHPRERPASVDDVLQALGRKRPIAPAGWAAPPRMVGREEEIATFSRWLGGFTRGDVGVRVLALEGTPGIGVSRLFREMVGRAELATTVLRASASEPEPFSWLLRAATGIAEPLVGALGALRALSLLTTRSEPLLLALEDVDRLDSDEHELLAAFARALDEHAPVALLVCGESPLPGAAATRIAVRPLDREALRAWTRGALSEGALDELLRATGGVPAEIELELARRRRGAVPRAPRGRAPLRSESDADASLLAALVAFDGDLDARVLGVSADAFAGLGASVRREGERIRLRSRRDLETLRRSLPLDALRAAHRRAAEAFATRTETEMRSEQRDAELVFHLARSGALERAAATLRALEPMWRTSPRPFARRLCPLLALERMLDPETILTIGEIALLAGEPDQALSAAARCLRARPGTELTARARLLTADALLRLGQPARAERVSSRAAEGMSPPELRASMFERIARARLQSGDPTGAERAALRGLDLAQASEVRRALSETLGLAASYLGRTNEAEARLSALLDEVDPAVLPRDACRLRSALAILAFRAGRARVAAEHHAAALALAERHGFDDLASLCLLNLGTAQHQAGDLGAALASYERGLGMARALGRESTELTLRYNLANLRAEIGELERARHELDTLERRAAPARLFQLAPALAILRAELALHSGALDAAERAIDGARSALAERGLERELLEVELLAADLESARGVVEAAASRAAATAERARALSALDLELRAEIPVARAELARGDDAGLDRLERARARAAEAGQELLHARLATELARAAEARAAPEAALHVDRARRSWDRMAANLSEADRDAFFRDPRRALGTRPVRVTEPPGVGATDAAALRRLLSLSRRINSSLSLERVFEYAVDAAVELTGAERGFLLRASAEGPPRVAARRAADAAAAPSQSIVQRVLTTQEPVVTTDATTDERFVGQGSVHAMRLKSVLSVPISTPDRALGVLYVDSRIQRTRFGDSERALLLSLADQVAVAIANAELHAHLAQRTAELEQKQRTIERLSAERERELEELRERVATQARAFQLRYDYEHIVGRGPKMRAVLEQLDRIVETDVNVLVLGESGTGKELVARALHANGPRAKGPFVGVNCAAVPEALLESELFGHARGAFTGADRDRKGLLLAANGGTLFLDELGEMPLATQAKLLRVLQEREVRPLGATRSVSFDVRLVCATQRDLPADVASGRFREDLFYRVAVVIVRLPPLRERLEDLPELARSLLARIAERQGRPAPELTSDALRTLALHPFPGNVRELENALTRAFVLSDGRRIAAADLDLSTAALRVPRSGTREEYEREERERILAALRATRWNVSVVARTLGIPRNTLYRKLTRYGIHRQDSPPGSERGTPKFSGPGATRRRTFASDD